MTKQTNTIGITDAIDDTAAAWAARRLSGAFSAGDQEALDAWLGEDPRHETSYREYLELADMSAVAGAASGRRQAANDEHEQKRTGMPRWGALAGMAAAASVVFAAVAISDFGAQPAQTNQYAAAAGETRAVTLSDGSTISLNAGAALTVRMENSERLVKLDRGEAFFDITRDENRPFTVVTEFAEARVLGTTFTAQAESGKASIRVHSGLVEVAGANSDGTLRLSKGEAVSVDSSGATSEIVRFDPGSAATWRLGYLQFENAPLSEVISELNRYYTAKMTIADPAIATRPVTGRFDIDDEETAVNALSIALALKVERPNARTVVFSAYD